MIVNKSAKAYLVGGGLESLAVAVYLIRDAGFAGEHITIFERSNAAGGSMQEFGLHHEGYKIKGIRMLNSSCIATFDLMSAIGSIGVADKTVLEETISFNDQLRVSARARLVKDGKPVWIDESELTSRMLDIKTVAFNNGQLVDEPIEHFFDPAFFDSDAWSMFGSVFCLQPWHSINQLMLCYQLVERHQIRVDTLEGLQATKHNQFDSLIFPALRWLTDRGVDIKTGCEVTDIAFSQSSENVRTAEQIAYSQMGNDVTLPLGAGDYVFVTTGSVTSDFSVGDHQSSAELQDLPGRDWALWHTLSKKYSDLGNPSNFVDRIRQTTIVSFTVTSPNGKFFQLMEQLSGNIDGSAGLTTLPGSNWSISFCLPHQPYFLGQPEGLYTFWGYAMNPYNLGNFIKKAMIECSGEEILKELIAHLGFGEHQHRILEHAICRPIVFPYFTAPLLATAAQDKPSVVPDHASNFAIIGQFSRLENYPSLSVEYSVRSARDAVYKLLHIG